MCLLASARFLEFRVILDGLAPRRRIHSACSWHHLRRRQEYNTTVAELPVVELRRSVDLVSSQRMSTPYNMAVCANDSYRMSECR